MQGTRLTFEISRHLNLSRAIWPTNFILQNNCSAVLWFLTIRMRKPHLEIVWMTSASLLPSYTASSCFLASQLRMSKLKDASGMETRRAQAQGFHSNEATTHALLLSLRNTNRCNQFRSILLLGSRKTCQIFCWSMRQVACSCAGAAMLQNACKLKARVRTNVWFHSRNSSAQLRQAQQDNKDACEMVWTCGQRNTRKIMREVLMDELLALLHAGLPPKFKSKSCC